MVDIAKLEEKIDKTAAGSTAISMRLGGVQFQTMMELMEFAKLMAVAGAAVPAHLRGNAGACLGICTKALRFGFDPFSLAEHSMVMVKKQKDDLGQWHDVETIAYDSFVIAAIINAHAPIEGRMTMSFSGEGAHRKCTVRATPKGQKEPLEYESPEIGDITKHIGTNDKGQLKGSPLWITNPDQQLAYWTRRAFCRRNFPETLLGWYDREELEENDYGPEKAKDITPKPPRPDFRKRITKKGKDGFKPDNVEQATAGANGGLEKEDNSQAAGRHEEASSQSPTPELVKP